MRFLYLLILHLGFFGCAQHVPQPAEVIRPIPEIQSIHTIPLHAEPFKKEIILINLDEPVKNQFFPDKDFLLAEVNSHLWEYRQRENFDYPWAMDFLPNGDILVMVHHGRLLHYKRAEGKVVDIGGLPDDIAHGEYQLGLLDIIIDERFDDNHKIYFSYVAEKDTSGSKLYTTCVIKATLIKEETTINKKFCAKPWTAATSQFGGALAITNAGYLFLSVGDRSVREKAQDPAVDWGKILRLKKNDLTGSSTRFFFDHNGRQFSMGHRNPQGLYYDPATKVLYETEHGPQGGDELNIIKAGKNYGWPTITYGTEYETSLPIGEGTAKPGIEQPVYYFSPSIGTSAVMVYHGDMFPEWKDSIFIASLSGLHINRTTLQDEKVVREERFLGYMQMRFRDIKEGPDGAIYILSEDGFIMRLYR